MRTALSGKTVLITGGTRGIGQMLAHGLAARGAFVEVAGRSADILEETVTSIGPEHCAGTAVDLTTDEGLQALVDAVSSRHQHLDVLLNNAATSRFTPIDADSHSLAIWDRVFRLNVAVPFSLTVQLLPLLTSTEPTTGERARVINIGSIDGLRPPEHDAFAYASSKAALHHLTEMLAPKLARRGVLVNALALSAFATRMSAERLDGVLTQMAAANPVGRLGEAPDIIGAVTFLSSPESAFVNGAVIPVDGGIRNRTLPLHALAEVLDPEQFTRVVCGNDA